MSDWVKIELYVMPDEFQAFKEVDLLEASARIGQALGAKYVSGLTATRRRFAEGEDPVGHRAAGVASTTPTTEGVGPEDLKP